MRMMRGIDSGRALMCFAAAGFLLGCEHAPPPAENGVTPPPSTMPSTQPTPVAPLPLPPASADLVLAADESQLGGASLESVKLISVLHLWVRARVPAVTGLTELDLTFTSPRGDTFLQQKYPFSSDATTNVSIGAAGQSIVVQHPTALAAPSTGYALDVMLPIAGSAFEHSGSPGNWVVTATVLRNGLPDLTLTRPFVLDVHT